ncbi:hypothetical protein EW145_g4891 [Phellinidium pouzarii]|uniref:Glyoxalase-like domain-containing protein n=1 Tax=Phellinidium pouzarii TaxID=167371 RepID=A0A4S4L2G9_9AGAM|nr:hypothetical protein EW145_g4891 [Phellinidium pouzarii]
MSTKILDHIVHLTPPGSIAKTIESWEKLGFKVTPGGTHADGLTENALVILADTTYLELISFTHEPTYYTPGSSERAARDAHAWAGKVPGWIDFALLGFGTSNPAPKSYNLSSATPSTKTLEEQVFDLSDLINARAAREGSGAVYTPTRLTLSVTGGVSFRSSVEMSHNGNLENDPIIKVPVSRTSTTHPNTSRSVAYLRLHAPATVYPDITKQIMSVIGVPPTVASPTESSWELQAPKHPDAILDYSIPRHNIPAAPRLVLSSTEPHSDESIAETGRGVIEIAFWVEEGNEKEDKTPYGKIVWLAGK